MNIKTKIYIGIAAAIAISSLTAGLWQSWQITKLERSVRDAKQIAEEKRFHADAKELEAAEYKQKIDYLEARLSEIQTQKRRQDENLEKLNINSRAARGNVERAKRTRAIDADTAELCSKLAELGHGC